MSGVDRDTELGIFIFLFLSSFASEKAELNMVDGFRYSSS